MAFHPFVPAAYYGKGLGVYEKAILMERWDTMSEMNTPMAECVGSPRVMGEASLDTLPLAMSYTPMQKWENIYAPEVGLDRGTIFACLDLPFVGKEEAARGNAR